MVHRASILETIQCVICKFPNPDHRPTATFENLQFALRDLEIARNVDKWTTPS